MNLEKGRGVLQEEGCMGWGPRGTCTAVLSPLPRDVNACCGTVKRCRSELGCLPTAATRTPSAEEGPPRRRSKTATTACLNVKRTIWVTRRTNCPKRGHLRAGRTVGDCLAQAVRSGGKQDFASLGVLAPCHRRHSHASPSLKHLGLRCHGEQPLGHSCATLP